MPSNPSLGLNASITSPPGTVTRAVGAAEGARLNIISSSTGNAVSGWGGAGIAVTFIVSCTKWICSGVGWLVGAVVGADGAWVGDFVVGRAVGMRVGAMDGTAVGYGVGGFEGFGVGVSIASSAPRLKSPPTSSGGGPGAPFPAL